MNNQELKQKLREMKKYQYPSDQIALDKAIKLVDRDTKMKPLEALEGFPRHKIPVCPVCQATVIRDYGSVKELFEFCQKCGQRIDWE